MYIFYNASLVIGFHMFFKLVVSVSCPSPYSLFYASFPFSSQFNSAIPISLLSLSITVYSIYSPLEDRLLPPIPYMVPNLCGYSNCSTHIESLKANIHV